MTIRRLIKLVFALLATLAVVSALLIGLAAANRRALVRLEEKRFEAYQLADELRQTSDDLTRFARTYVATGDPRFATFYQDVLAIRNGTKPRPENYHRVYWDLHIAGSTSPPTTGPAVSLIQLMERAGFTPQEVASLRDALAHSDALVALEETAMHAVRGEYRDASGAFTRRGAPDRDLAIRMMHDSTYHREKARIMAPIDAFLARVESRTSTELGAFAQRTSRLLRIITSILGVFLLTVLVSYPVLRWKVLLPLRSLQEKTRLVAADLERLAGISTRIAQGDHTQSFAVSTSPIDSSRRDEVGDLSRVHDSMVAQLQTTGAAIATVTADLRSANETLGQTVTRLRELERMRDDLVHMIVHDMRSPLTVLIANLDLMRMEASAEMAPSIDAAARGAVQLNQLASTVLDVSRLEEGKMPITREATDVAALAREVRSTMAALESDRTIDVTAHGAVRCKCDPGLIRRVLENLVSNAIKHTPRPGAVHITVTSLPSGVQLSVRDEGPGIPLEARGRIFEKFGAAAARKDRAYHSVGLGLAFCKLAVEAHGGSIRVEDAEPRGSAFIVELPA